MPDFKKTGDGKKRAKDILGTSWDGAAKWYDDLLESGEGTYQSDLILPNILRLLQLKKGEKVLDLGCGQGFFAREFFKTGAVVAGVDLSPKLIAMAKTRSPREIKFGVSSADKLDFWLPIPLTLCYACRRFRISKISPLLWPKRSACFGREAGWL